MYEQGSLGRAALALNLTQPALSKSIHHLERELGVELFERTPKGLAATVYADALSLHARSVLAELRRAEREIALLSGAAKGEVAVGATPSIAETLLPVAAAALHRERPGIQLTVIEGLVQDHAPALRRGELDLIVGGWTRDMDADLRSELLLQDVVQVFSRAGHPLTSTRPSLSRLLEYPWVLPPQTQFWVDHLDRTFVSNGLPPPQPALSSNSASFIKAVLREADFLTYLPSLLLQREVAAQELLAIDVKGLSIRIDVSITYRGTAVQPAAVSAFIEALRSAAAGVAR